MMTDKELERAQQDKEFQEEGSLVKTELTRPVLGPSDSSDSGSDRPAYMPDTDSDRNNTGERPQVENTGDEPLQDDIEPDKIVPSDEAGLAHTPADPVRNGGKTD
ncbi:MAG TPA: MatE family transporter [Eoetvoesiella sp.]